MLAVCSGCFSGSAFDLVGDRLCFYFPAFFAKNFLNRRQVEGEFGMLTDNFADCIRFWSLCRSARTQLQSPLRAKSPKLVNLLGYVLFIVFILIFAIKLVEILGPPSL